MKILITTDLYKGTINGVVISIKNLEKELISKGHDVKILTISERYKTYREGHVYYIKSIPAKFYPDIRLSVGRGGKYIKELIAWNPDVIHSQCEFFSFKFARIIQKATGSILIHTYHTLYEQYAKYLLLGKNTSKLVLKWINSRFRNADTVIAPTQKVKNSLIKYGTSNHIDIVPTGISLEKYAKKFTKAQIAKNKGKYGIAEETKIVLILGRLGYEKNISDILYGVTEILRTRDDVVLMIVGDGPAKEDLEATATELGIAKKVVFTGMIKPKDTPLFYKMADLFVSSSTSETQGLTYIEALACGLPLVCKKDPCVNKIIDIGINGFVFETKDDIKNYILKVLYDKENFIFDKETSIAMAEKFSIAKFGENAICVYKNAMLRKEGIKTENLTIRQKQKFGYMQWYG